jgi:hypothetical protein
LLGSNPVTAPLAGHINLGGALMANPLTRPYTAAGQAALGALGGLFGGGGGGGGSTPPSPGATSKPGPPPQPLDPQAVATRAALSLAPRSVQQSGQFPVATIEQAQGQLQDPNFYQSLINPVLNTLGQQGMTATPAAQQTGIPNAIEKLVTQSTAALTKQQAAADKAQTAADKANTKDQKAQVDQAFAAAFGGRNLDKVATAAKMNRDDVARITLNTDGTPNQDALTAFNGYVDAVNTGKITNTATQKAWLNNNVKPAPGQGAAASSLRSFLVGLGLK